MTNDTKPRRVLIVGGGFAGLAAARALQNSPVTVTLIDRTDHHLFQPLLYQYASGVLSEGQIATPLRHILRHHHNTDCVMAEVVSVDPAGRSVIANRPDGSRLEIGYDNLIVACGARQSYFGHDEFAQHAPGMKTIADASTIRRRVFHAFELAETMTDLDQRRHWLTFAVVGAGPTGVELAGQIRELATKTLRAEYRHVDAGDARVLAFDGGPHALRSFGPRGSAKAETCLRELGVELHVHSIVTQVDADGVVVRSADGTTTRHDVGTVMWTAGVHAPPIADNLAKATGATQDKAGRIQVEPDCTIPGHPEISVVGDLMSLNHLPGVAEVAMQSGRYVGLRIKHDVDGTTGPRRFRYKDLGSAAYLSRGHAIVAVGPVRMNGLLGWLIWLFVHIAFLTGFRNRVSAVLTWLVTFSREARRERALPARRVGTRSAPA